MTSEQIIEIVKQQIFNVEYDGIEKNWDGGTTITVVVVVQRKCGLDVICVSLGDSPAFLIFCKANEIFYYHMNDHDDLD